MLSSDAREVLTGGYVNLSWTSSYADYCQAGGDWSGEKASGGVETIGPIQESSTFSLNCVGAGGEAVALTGVVALGSVAVSWSPPTENVDGSPVSGIALYRVHSGSSPGAYDDVVEVDGALSGTTITAVSGPIYVAMTAVDMEGDESGLSNEVVLEPM